MPLFADESTGAIVRDIMLAMFSLFGTVFAGYMSYLMYRLKAAQTVSDEKLEVVHKATNSLVSKLVAKTDEESYARGVKSQTDLHPPPESPPGGVP